VIYKIAEYVGQPFEYVENMNIVEAFNYYAFKADESELRNEENV